MNVGVALEVGVEVNVEVNDDLIEARLRQTRYGDVDRVRAGYSNTKLRQSPNQRLRRRFIFGDQQGLQYHLLRSPLPRRLPLHFIALHCTSLHFIALRTSVA